MDSRRIRSTTEKEGKHPHQARRIGRRSKAPVGELGGQKKRTGTLSPLVRKKINEKGERGTKPLKLSTTRRTDP